MQNPIKFGTSGHRGIRGQAFTFEHVVAIAQAIAEFVQQQKQKDPIKLLIGYDPRPGNHPDHPQSFSAAIAQIWENKSLQYHVIESPTPTPVISWLIQNQKYSGGVILTASHNPPEYSGLKFNPSNGAPAPNETTTWIESRANELLLTQNSYSPKPIPKHKILPLPLTFCEETLKTIQPFFKTSPSGASLVADPRHGTSGPFWLEFAKKQSLSLTLLNDSAKEDFGGIEPNPTKHACLAPLIQEVQNNHAILGVANDPDADRHVIVDEKGTLVTPEELTLIVSAYFCDQNFPVNKIISTVASSMRLKKAAKILNISYNETAVGFKHFAPFLEKARQTHHIAFAVESSGGFSASFHTLEKCGFLPALLLLYICNETKTPLSVLKHQAEIRFGTSHFVETEFHFDPCQKTTLVNALQTLPLSEINRHYSSPFPEINRTDGLKLASDTEWTLCRPSGTEPLIRIYSEATTESQAKKRHEETTQFLNAVIS